MPAERFPTFRRAGRWLAPIAPRAAFGALVVFVLAAIPWTCLNIKWGRRLQRELAALKADGMPVSPQDLIPKPIPDADNAAVVYQQVFRIPPSRWDGSGEPNHPIPASPAGLGGLSHQEQRLLEEYLKAGGRDRRKQCRRLLARPQVRDTLQTLRRASQRPHSVFPVKWEAGLFALFPQFRRFRQASTLLTVQAALLAEDGRVKEAFDWCGVALRVSDHAAEQSMVGQLVSYAMRRQLFEAMRGFLCRVQVSPDAA